MTEFINSTIKFLFSFFIFFIFSFAIILTITKLNSRIFKVDQSKHVLILGDTQIECSLDDSILTNSI